MTKKKGKKKNKKSHQISQEEKTKPLTIREFSPPPPPPPPRKDNEDSDYGGEIPETVSVGVMVLEERIRQMRICRDTGAALPKECPHDLELLPILETELRVLKAKIRKDQIKADRRHNKDVDQESATSETSSGEIEIDLTPAADEEREYYDDLGTFVDMWRVLACDGRNGGKKSLIELLRVIDRSDEEGARVFDAVRATLVGIGIRISSSIVEYLSLFVESLDDLEIETRVRVIKNTIVIESVGSEIPSPVIGRFVAVIESAERKIRVSQEETQHDDDDDVVLPWFGERERRLLGLIFFKVIQLEVFFGCPSFPENLENKDLLKTEEYLRNVYFHERKFERLSSEMNEFKKLCESVGGPSSKQKEVREVLDSEINGIWQELDLLRNNQTS